MMKFGLNVPTELQKRVQKVADEIVKRAIGYDIVQSDRDGDWERIATFAPIAHDTFNRNLSEAIDRITEAASERHVRSEVFALLPESTEHAPPAWAVIVRAITFTEAPCPIEWDIRVSSAVGVNVINPYDEESEDESSQADSPTELKLQICSAVEACRQYAATVACLVEELGICWSWQNLDARLAMPDSDELDRAARIWAGQAEKPLSA